MSQRRVRELRSERMKEERLERLRVSIRLSSVWYCEGQREGLVRRIGGGRGRRERAHGVDYVRGRSHPAVHEIFHFCFGDAEHRPEGI